MNAWLMATFGYRLRLSRETAGKTLEDLAGDVGIAYQQLWRYEQDRNKPPVEFIKRAAITLNVSADYLLGLVDEPAAVLTENDLSPMERKLIAAVRNGAIVEALEAFTALTKHDDKPVTSAT